MRSVVLGRGEVLLKVTGKTDFTWLLRFARESEGIKVFLRPMDGRLT